MSQSKDIKIIVIGNNGTGKTKLLNKYINNIFDDEYKHTIVTEYCFKIYEKDGKIFRIQLLGLAGYDENYREIKITAHDAHGCIIMSDATYIKTREE